MRWMTSLSGLPYFFSFSRGWHAYLNGPPVPHERLTHGSRHSLVKTSRIIAFGGVCGGGCFLAACSEHSFVAEYFPTPSLGSFRPVFCQNNLIDVSMHSN